LANQKNIKIERPYFKNLDALRFLAAFSVFIFHFFNEFEGMIKADPPIFVYQIITSITNKGLLGVNFFFVLSGFLITYLILFEVKQTGQFQYLKFLVRRTLRIWPLYFIIVLLGFFIFPFIFHGVQTEHQLINYIFFMANFDEIWYGANDSINFLTAPWSVAVEEQFYFVWGLLLLVLIKLKRLKLPIVIVVLLIISLVFRYLNFNSHNIIYYHTLSVIPDILVGSFLGYAFFHKKPWLMRLKSLSKLKITLIYLIGFVLILLKTKLFFGPLIIAERFVFAIFFAFILLDQVFLEHSFFKVGKIKLFNHLGKISYGLYMYHLVVLFLIQKYFLYLNITFEGSYLLVITLFLVSSTALTYLTAVTSYFGIEKPFLKLKQRFI
jgi:peptidoglycan/LPS O-acetylase OafA/YrhL